MDPDYGYLNVAVTSMLAKITSVCGVIDGALQPVGDRQLAGQPAGRQWVDHVRLTARLDQGKCCGGEVIRVHGSIFSVCCRAFIVRCA